MNRRTALATALKTALGAGFGIGLGSAALYGASQALGQGTPRRIGLQAKKFEFTPTEITVKRGNPVTLVLTSLDFDHGFSCPDFKLRSDFIPGREIELNFTPEKAGRYLFVCDNFCGEGHDDMSGVIIVTEA